MIPRADRTGDRPRVVALTDKSDRHFHFLDRLASDCNLVGVIAGAKHVRMSRTRKALRRLRTARSRRAFLVNLYYDRRFRSALSALRSEKSAAEAMYFAGSRERFAGRFDGHYEEVGAEHESVNDPYFEDLIRSLRPDVLAVMGTCMLRKNIIDSAPLVLNLHTGLSPYYRGGMTNFWPVIHDEPNCFGVTIHIMSLGIDAGDVVLHGVPPLQPLDGFATVNCKSIVIGSRLMARAIELHALGSLVAVKQWTKGKLFFERDFNGLAASTYMGKKRAFFAAAAAHRGPLPPGLILDQEIQRLAERELR